MTHSIPTPPNHPPHTAPKRRIKGVVIPVVLLIVGLILGGAVGAGSAKPEVQEKIVEKEIKITETPQSCLFAIQHAESVFKSSVRTTDILSDIVQATAARDTAEMVRLGDKIEDETKIVEEIGPKYREARDACQASR